MKRLRELFGFNFDVFVGLPMIHLLISFAFMFLKFQSIRTQKDYQ